MDVNEKLINNVISFFSETRITEQFRNVFLEEMKNNETFQNKLQSMLEADEAVPGDEKLWKKIIDADPDLTTQEMKEKLFKKFEELLQQIFQSTESVND